MNERFEQEKLNLFGDILDKGLTLCVKVTGRSMSPFLRGGETLMIKKVPYKTLRKGDLIFFKSPDAGPVIHRIVEKKRNTDNTYTFRTKGDAVPVMDSPVREDDILGKICRIEKTGTECRRNDVDMEMPIWKGINFSLALVSLGKGKVASRPAIAGLLRRIKKTFL